jgi:hypothetical protein
MGRSEENEPAARDVLAAGSLVANGACRTCGAPVTWVKTARGRNLPLDPEPSDNPHEGNFGLSTDGVAYFVRDAARMAAFNVEGTHSEFPIYIAHFATCPAR